MKPIAAMEKPAMMNGDRCCTCSDQKAKMRTMIMAKTSTRRALANHPCWDETGIEMEQRRRSVLWDPSTRHQSCCRRWRGEGGNTYCQDVS